MRFKVGDLLRYTANNNGINSFCIITEEYKIGTSNLIYYRLYWMDDYANKHYDSRDYLARYFNTDSWSKLS
jgi:hypothetical protein